MVPSKWLDGIDLVKLSKHNLAARTLANTVCPEFEILEKDEYGKPFFESADHRISITHSGKYAGFMLKEDDECGIDMEHISDRIERIRSKFLREDESEFANHGLHGLYLVWCAKEAMYKYYGLKALDFKRDMKVEYGPVSDQGQFRGHIEKGDFKQTLELSYEIWEDYIIVHTN